MSFQEASFYFLVLAVNQVSRAGTQREARREQRFPLVLLWRVGHTVLTAGLDSTFAHGLLSDQCSNCTFHMLMGKGITLMVKI